MRTLMATAFDALPGEPVEAHDLGAVPALDPADFDGFARSQIPGLLRLATALAGDPHQGSDLVQEVLLRAAVRWERIARTDRPDLYLRRMLTNEHLSWRRRWQTRHVVAVDDQVLHAAAPPVNDPAHSVVLRDEVRSRLASLPRRQRSVLVLRYWEGLEDTQIAWMLGVTSSTVRSTAARALAALRADVGGPR